MYIKIDLFILVFVHVKMCWSLDVAVEEIT